MTRMITGVSGARTTTQSCQASIAEAQDEQPKADVLRRAAAALVAGEADLTQPIELVQEVPTQPASESSARASSSG